MISDVVFTREMEAKDYLAYIAYFWKNYAQTIPKRDFVAFLHEKIGSDVINAPLPKVRITARLLYRGSVASMYTKYSPYHIVSTLDSDTIKTFLEETIALNERYGIFYPVVDYNLGQSSVDAGIKRISMLNYKAVLTDLLETPTKPKVKKAAAATTKPKVKKEVAKPKTRNIGPPAKVKKTAVVTATNNKVVRAKKAPQRKCEDYKIAELKKIASELRLTGVARLKKTDLCEVLGI